MTRQGDVVGKLFAGYQGWFNAFGDGSPNGRWIHWTRNGAAPSTSGDAEGHGNLTFELYPDVREYDKLYATDLGELGDGTPAKLFSSFDAGTVNKHFEWMRDYGIDGAALQRFGASDSDAYNEWRANRDSVAAKAMAAAEANGRKFYVMYDTSGLRDDHWAQAIRHDWLTNVAGTLRLIDSPAYARQDGKLVVCIWGIGFTDRPGTAAEAAALIAWFRERGYYVIGGVPTNWRTSDGDSKSGFGDVYRAFDMISPWFVGRFGGIDGADRCKEEHWRGDFELTQRLGIAYQPVIWPGFAWSHLHKGPRNQLPRLHGDFMWRQAYHLRNLGIDTGYVAMFDEYDEGTAIAKAAANRSTAPADTYFLTLDADGVAVSADFYLRLAGDIRRLLAGELPPTEAHPTSHE